MRLSTTLALVRREARGARGRLAFLVACLAVGVAAVVSVAGLSASLDGALRDQARTLLAADLAVKGRRPAPETLDPLLAAVPGLERASVREMATVVAAPPATPGGPPGRSQLVELKVVQGGYPFYGDLRLSPDRPLPQLLGEDGRPGAVVAPDLLSRLGLAVGDELRIGGESFPITGTVEAEPDRIELGLTLGPRVFLSAAGLEQAGLVRKGSRVEYVELLKVPHETREQLAALAERLEAALPPDFQVESWRQAQPALRAALGRLERFLGLVALLSLLVGGIGVAQTVRAWIAQRLDAVAVLKCLGLRGREVLTLYLVQGALLGLAGGLLGCLAGSGVLALLPHLLPSLLPGEVVDPWQPLAWLRGTLLGLGVAVLFVVPPLLAVRRIPPARVLRRDAEPLPVHRPAALATGLLLAAGLFALATVQSGSPRLGAGFVAGLAVAVAVLALAARLLARVTGRLGEALGRRRPRAVALRHGLAALGRPDADTLGAVVALGLGVLVVSAVGGVEGRLAERLTTSLPADAPTAFLVDIQPDQWPGVRALLEDAGALDVQSLPVVTARLAAVDGVRAEDLAGDGTAPAREGEDLGPSNGAGRDRDVDRSRRWALTREQRLTYRQQLAPDNRVLRGRLWSDPQRAEVSVEEGYARDLGVDLGSRLTLDVQGVPVELAVTSVRSVDWASFNLNFFLTVEPGVLDAAPQQRVATVALPEGTAQQVQDRLAAEFPNVTFLRVREILETVAAVLRRLALGVRFLGGFTVLAGLAILGGAVSAGAVRRGREVALLKTLGWTRRQVVTAFTVEHALAGLVAALPGVVAGEVLAGFVLGRLDVAWTPALGLPLALLAVTAGLAAVAGLAAGRRALARRPLEVLRQG